MLLWWLATTALAQEPCPKIPDLTEQAWSAFNDAELAQAKGILASANNALACQTDVVSTDELLALYRLDALVSLSLEDRKGAVYATIRAVTTSPEDTPGEELGPQLMDLHSTWAARLKDSTVQVSMAGAGSAWVDGRALESGESVTTPAGEHLVQVRGADDSFSSSLQDLSTDLMLMTGGETPDGAGDGNPDGAGDGTGDGTDPVDPDKPDKPEKPKKPKKKGGAKVPLIVLGSVAAAGGAGATGLAWSWERSFLADDYLRPSFGSCDAGDDCYNEERRKAIISDAKNIRGMYTIGYAALGVGVALAGTGLFVVPSPTSGGGMAVLSVKW